jgi:predicted transcriptional regulator
MSSCCVDELVNFYQAKGNSAEELSLWKIVLALQQGADPSRFSRQKAQLRKAFSIKMRTLIEREACVKRRYQPDLKRFEESVDCTWRMPAAAG